MMNKKAQMIDTEVFTSPMFVLLTFGALAATLLGWGFSLRMGMATMPLWNLIVVLAVEVVACYFFAWKMGD